MIPAIILSGDTYPIRREIRAMGGAWSGDLHAHVVPADKRDQVLALVGTRKISVSDDEVPDDIFVPLTGEALRAYRQDRADRKAARLRERAGKKAVLADQLFDREHRIADMIPLGQPILVGHHSQRRHERDIERIQRLSTQACEAFRESKHLAEVADRLEAGVSIKGDAEKRHEAHRQKIRETVKVGDIVEAGCYGPKEVIKINRKTLQVTGAFGPITIDMSLVGRF